VLNPARTILPIKTMKTAFKKPEHKISFGQLAGVVVIQTINLDGKTFAWNDDDGRYLSTVDGIDRHEDVAKEWVVEWFNVRPNHNVKVMRFNRSPNGETFIIQIKRIS
jgi:hypothetical protein